MSGTDQAEAAAAELRETGVYLAARAAAAEQIVAEVLRVGPEGRDHVVHHGFEALPLSVQSRSLDLLTADGIAIEVKLGRAEFAQDTAIDTEIIKDIQLIGQTTNRGRVVHGILWVFVVTESGVGPSGTTLAVLDEYGVDYTIVGFG